MKIAIVGTGNIAFQMGMKLAHSEINIEVVIGRNEKKGRNLAEKLNCRFTNNFDAKEIDCNIFLLAISDSAIGTVAKKLNRPDATLIHTSGSISIDALPAAKKGVIWPLYSITEKRTLDWREIPLISESSNAQSEKTIKSLVIALEGKHYTLDSDQRAHAHLLAVLSNNFVHHLFYLKEAHQRKNKIDPSIFHSILKDTFDKILEGPEASKGLKETQTGPAIRQDHKTIYKHLDLLNDSPTLKALYESFTSSILKTYHGEEL